MKRPSKKTERWLIAILGMVSLFLMVSLVRRILSGTQVSAAPASRPGGRASAVPGGPARDDLARYNVALNLDLLKQIETHPLPESSRNPFEYPPPPKPKASDTPIPTPAPPPPPPPLPLKAIGYSVKAGNIPEAVVADDQDIYVVHQGDTFAKRYHVLTLTPNRIEIKDDTTHQTVELPIAP